MLRHAFRSLLLIPMVTLACGGSTAQDDRGGPSIEINGSVVGPNVPNSSRVGVLWGVTSGDPDYFYKHGGGIAFGPRLQVTVDEPPPPEAINRYGIGFGFLMLLDGDEAISDGVVEDLDALVDRGTSVRHVVIWRAEDARRGAWVEEFEPGFSCGRCVPAPPGETFDGFEPVDCSEMIIETDLTDPDWCNWT